MARGRQESGNVMRAALAALLIAGIFHAAYPAEKEKEMSEESNALMVPMEVTYQAAWLSWVASTTGCLKSLGVDCDNADVAGMSGYAFHLCIHEDLCPSGPTVLDWEVLSAGVNYLGRSTLCFSTRDCPGEDGNAPVLEHCREAFELARREVAAGRPCVMWGAYLPEFAAVAGIDGDCYILKSFKEDGGPLRWDETDVPGGPYTLAFPTETNIPQAAADRFALANAVKTFNSPSHLPYSCGAAAYDAWIASLEGKRANGFGNSYNAACYAEARGFAFTFLKRVAARNAFASEKLAEAAAAYGKAAEALGRVHEMFPFPGEEDKPVADEEKIAAAVKELKNAREAECRAVEILAEVAAMAWPEE